MKKHLIMVLTLLTVIVTGCAVPSASQPPDNEALPPASISLPASLAEGGNFRFLVSDEKNDIDDFSNLFITISKIGIQPANSENWTQFTPAVTECDLKLLIGDNATSLWSGNITPGKYEKVFIYISDVSGILASAADNQSLNIKLPGGKLQISKPFTISENTTTSFVFDVTVIKTGNDKSGGKYILKPQIEMSGPDQKIKEVKAEGEHGNKQIRSQDGGEDKGSKDKPAKGNAENEKAGITLKIEGKPAPGAEVTLLATDGKNPVSGAVISVSGSGAGTTGADGKLKITLPSKPGEVQIKAVSGNITGELELDLRPLNSGGSRPEK